MFAGAIFGTVHQLGQLFVEHIDYQRRLTTAADAGDGHKLAQRNPHIDIAQVVLSRPADLQIVAIALAPDLWHFNAPFAAQILGGKTLLVFDKLLARFRGHHIAAMFTSAGSHVNYPVGGTNGILVMFDDQDGVAQVAHPLQGFDQPRVIALVQTDARLVENVEHPH